MICETFIDQLQAPADGQPDPAQLAALEVHLGHCQSCRAARVEHRQYLQVMQGFQAPEPAAGRLAHMLREARRQGEAEYERRNSRAGFFKGFATAAALAMVALAGQWQYQQIIARETPAPTIAGHSLSRQVMVVINVPADMPATRLMLDFPDALRLEGLEDMQQVNWRVDLERGSNVLTLPVTVAAGTNLAERLSIKATVLYHKKQKNFELPVELLAPDLPGHGSLFETGDPPQLHI